MLAHAISEQQRNGAEKNHQGRSRIADETVQLGSHIRAGDVAILIRMVGHDGRGKRVHFRVRHGERDARFQPRDGIEHPCAALFEGSALSRERHPHLRRLSANRKAEAGWRNTHHDIWLPIEGDARADDLSESCAEARRPEIVAQNGDARAGAFLLLDEPAAE